MSLSSARPAASAVSSPAARPSSSPPSSTRPRPSTPPTSRPPRHIPLPAIREPDGLAMSSRNVFLSPENRRRAAALSQSLHSAQGCATPQEAQARMSQTLAQAGVHDIDYAAVRDAETLMPL